MEAKHRGKQVLGGVLVFVGCGVSLLVLRLLAFGHIVNVWMFGGLGPTLWNVGRLVLLAALSVYLVCSGLRMINPKLAKPFRFGWGKILFGSLMILSGVGSHYHLVPDGPIPYFKPSNSTEAVSMKVTNIALSIIFACLIFRGIREGFVQRDSHAAQPPPSG